MVLEDDDKPFEYKEEVSYIDQCISWCENISLILFIYIEPGYAFHSLNENKLFDDQFYKKDI